MKKYDFIKTINELSKKFPNVDFMDCKITFKVLNLYEFIKLYESNTKKIIYPNIIELKPYKGIRGKALIAIYNKSSIKLKAFKEVYDFINKNFDKKILLKEDEKTISLIIN